MANWCALGVRVGELNLETAYTLGRHEANTYAGLYLSTVNVALIQYNGGIEYSGMRQVTPPLAIYRFHIARRYPGEV